MKACDMMALVRKAFVFLNWPAKQEIWDTFDFSQDRVTKNQPVAVPV